MMADRLFGWAFVAMAIAIVGGTINIQTPFEQMGDPGPRLLPFLLAAGLGILGACLALRRGRPPAPTGPAEDEAEAPAGPGMETLSPPSRHVQLALAAALIAYVALFERLGFTVATLLFLSVAMSLLGDRSLRSVATSVGLAALLTLSIGGFLAGVIGVPLPGVLVP